MWECEGKLACMEGNVGKGGYLSVTIICGYDILAILVPFVI